MFSRVSGFFLLLPLGISLVACSYKVQKGAGAQGEIRPSAELISRVSFSDVYTKVFQPRCISCHGISGGVNLETYASARSFLSRINEATVVQRRMPPSPAQLTLEELELVAAWVQAGGPEMPLNGAPVEPPPPPPVLKPTFASIKELIIDRKCLQCHVAGGKASQVPLTKLSDFLDSPLEIVIPGNSEESGLVLVLLEGARKKMPPPESGISPVSREEIQVIQEWIDNMSEAPREPDTPPDTPPSPENPPDPPLPPDAPPSPDNPPSPDLPHPPETPRDPPQPSPLKPTFASIKELIIDRKCLQCHSPGEKAERVPLNQLRDLIESPLEIVIPGNPEESGLVLVLREGARKRMPPPDSGVAPVGGADIKIIEEWIRNGATN